MRRQGLVVCGALLAACVSRPVTAEQERHRCSSANPVLRWTDVASEVFPRQPGPILDGRAFAIFHAAIHDALNGIERRYRPYTADLSSPAASSDAAVAAAAREVLLDLAPEHRERIESEYAAVLAEIPDGPAETEGVVLGVEAAHANLERRAADGVPVVPFPPLTGPIAEPPYEPNGQPGDYAFTPPFDRPPFGPVALLPGWGRLPTFAVARGRVSFGGPDPLGSRQYARDMNFLKSIGRSDSTTRTPDQTQIARFWFEPLDTWYRIATRVLRQERAGSWRSARILALMSFAVADADILVFEAKYRYRFWRPFTAIRAAAQDGNDATEPDESWIPLLWTEGPTVPPAFFIPPIPEYPSSAAIVSAAASEVLIRHLGDRHRFEAISTTLPGVRRRFARLSDAARETRLSRVYGGIHFLRAIEDGRAAGRRIGASVSRLLPPVQR